MRRTLVVERKGGRIYLKIKGDTVHSLSIYDPTKVFVGGVWDYLGVLPAINNSKKVLLIGVAGGTVTRIIFHCFRNIKVDGVDNDKRVIEIGKKYFHLGHRNLKIHISDAERFLKKSKATYDLILQDAFVGTEIPKRLTTPAFFGLVKSHLNKGGILAVNLLTTQKILDYAFRLVNYFTNVYVLVPYHGTGNIIVIASDSVPDFSKLSRFKVLKDTFEIRKFNSSV